MKKIILPLVLLIVGLVTGFYIGKSKNEPGFADTKSIEAYKSALLAQINSEAFRFSPDTSHVITFNDAQKCIDEFRKRNAASLTPLLSSNNSAPLKGFYVDTIALKDILKNKKFNGISFYLAKSHSKLGVDSNFYSLILTGARRILKPGLPSGSKPSDSTYVNEAPYWNYIDPCPTVCGDL